MKPVGYFLGVVLAAAVLLGPTSVRAVDDDVSVLEQVFADAVMRIRPSIVSVSVQWKPGKERVRPSRGPVFFRRGTGPFTGVVISSDGLIITSDFNVNADAEGVTVTVPGRPTEYPAEILGRDVSRGVQLLRIEAKDLAVPTFAPDDSVKVGRWALACGVGESNGTRTHEAPSLSLGIISATERIAGRAIQIDAATNPSNYGGPLIDVEGRLVGVITPLTHSGSEEGITYYDSGVGFAVPVSDVLAQLPKLEAGKVTSWRSSRGVVRKRAASSPVT